MKVFDICGKEIVNILSKDANTVVDLKDRPTGVYVVRMIGNDNNVVTKRIIKK